MARTMKAAVVHEFKKPLSIEEVPVPEVGPGQVLVKIEACGVCHTDLHAADGDWPVKPTPPFIPGHEGVGNVVAVGRFGLWEKKRGALLETRDAGQTWSPVSLPTGVDTRDIDCAAIGCRIGPYFRLGWGGGPSR